MTLDMTKMKERMDSLKNNGGGKNKDFWRPQDGEQTIRIVPTADGDPFKDFHFHYNVGANSGFLCPKRNFGDECPVCNFATKLYNEKTPESIKEAKKFFARQRFFSPVLVRGEEVDGVRVWGYGKMAYESLLSLVLNPEYGDITDVDEGTDLVLSYGKPAGASFPQTKLTPRRRSSPLCEDLDATQCAEMLDNIPDFDGLFERKTADEVQTMLDEYLLDEDDSSTTSSETTRYGSKSSGDPATTSDEVNSVEASFDELLSANA